MKAGDGNIARFAYMRSMRLIRNRNLWEALAYGWAQIVPTIRDLWWIYAIWFAANCAFLAFPHAPFSSTIGWLIGFGLLTAPTLVASLRRSGATLTPGSTVVAALLFSLPMEIHGWFREFAAPYDHSRLTHLLILSLSLALYWLVYKIQLAAFFYVWTEHNPLGALRTSWKTVAGTDWWRVLFASAIPALIILVVVLLTILFSKPVTMHVITWLLILAATIWETSSLCALASTYAYDEQPTQVVSRGRYRIVNGTRRKIKRWMLRGASTRFRFDR